MHEDQNCVNDESEDLIELHNHVLEGNNDSAQPIYNQCSTSIPPENRKPEVFWYFQEV